MMKIPEKRMIVLILAIFALLTLISILDPLLLWDENAYLANARSHLTQANFTESFRFPFLEWIITAIWFVTGESILIARLAMILLSLATIYFVYLISKDFFPKQAFWITLIYSVSVPFLFWAFRIYTEVPTLLFILISF